MSPQGIRTESGLIKGDLRVTGDFTLLGMVTGSVSVASGAALWLHGLVRGDLHLEPEARVEVRGVVDGSVINRGGRLRLFGTVNQAVRAESGETLVHPKAVVAGGVIGQWTPIGEDSP